MKDCPVLVSRTIARIRSQTSHINNVICGKPKKTTLILFVILNFIVLLFYLLIMVPTDLESRDISVVGEKSGKFIGSSR